MCTLGQHRNNRKCLEAPLSSVCLCCISHDFNGVAVARRLEKLACYQKVSTLNPRPVASAYWIAAGGGRMWLHCGHTGQVEAWMYITVWMKRWLLLKPVCTFSNPLKEVGTQLIIEFIPGEHTEGLLLLPSCFLFNPPPFLFFVSSHLSFPPSSVPPLPSSLPPSLLYHLFFIPPSLPPRWQRLSWPPVTQKQARLSWQPPVVHMKWCMFIFRCLPFKTISNGLTGTLVPELQIFLTLWRSVARRACRHSLHESVRCFIRNFRFFIIPY